jgi:hypothetical protein
VLGFSQEIEPIGDKDEELAHEIVMADKICGVTWQVGDLNLLMVQFLS